MIIHNNEYIIADCVTSYNQGYRKTKNVVIQPNRTEEEFKVKCRLHEGPVTRILMREQGKIDFSNLRMNWYNYM